jgi:cation:H+ antiporter
MLTNVFLLAAGLVLLTGGASALVRGAAALALRLGLTPLVIGLTVVAFGTSAPELVVSIQAAVAGNPGIAVGNVLGSNIANIGLILGLAALMRPFRIDALLLKRDVPLMIGVSVLVAILLFDGTLGRVEGLGLVAGLVVYLTWSVRASRKETAAAAAVADAHADDIPETADGPAGRDLLLVAAGLGALVFGADLLVRGAVAIAEAAGVSDAIIGLTVVALGTSLPEMATSVVAAMRGHSAMAAGNVVGSNLFNLLGILGTAAVVHPLAAPGLETADLAVMVGFAAALVPLMLTGRRLVRWEGALLLAGYVGYVGYLATQHA